MDNFKKYIEKSESLDEDKSIYSEYFSWAKEIYKKMPNLSLELPSIKKRSKIIFINKNKNPILLQLKDGSKLYFTIDQYRRIKGTPEVGKDLEFVMQGQKMINLKTLLK